MCRLQLQSWSTFSILFEKLIASKLLYLTKIKKKTHTDVTTKRFLFLFSHDKKSKS